MGLKSIWRSIVKGEHAAAPGAVQLPKEEPLECVSREARRNEHLQNLGMKRNKSFRKSIAKKFKKKEKASGDQLDARGPPGLQADKENLRNVRSHKSTGATASHGQPPDVQIETRTSIGARIEGGRKVEEKRRRGKGGEGVAKDKVVEVEARTGGEVKREMCKAERCSR